MYNGKRALIGLKMAALLALACGQLWAVPARAGYRSMVVTVTAYNNVRAQTNQNPEKAAWGDKIHPGMQVIAVSRDLIHMGLTQGTKVAIQGFKKDFKVWDKMAPGIKRTVDIYMGKNVQKAKNFGRKRLRIWWYDNQGRTKSHSRGHQ